MHFRARVATSRERENSNGLGVLAAVIYVRLKTYRCDGYVDIKLIYYEETMKKESFACHGKKKHRCIVSIENLSNKRERFLTDRNYVLYKYFFLRRDETRRFRSDDLQKQRKNWKEKVKRAIGLFARIIAFCIRSTLSRVSYDSRELTSQDWRLVKSLTEENLAAIEGGQWSD